MYFTSCLNCYDQHAIYILFEKKLISSFLNIIFTIILWKNSKDNCKVNYHLRKHKLQTFTTK